MTETVTESSACRFTAADHFGVFEPVAPMGGFLTRRQDPLPVVSRLVSRSP